MKSDNNPMVPEYLPMNLRDTIAIQVMLELVKNNIQDNQKLVHNIIANDAYTMADVMLVRRGY